MQRANRKQRSAISGQRLAISHRVLQQQPASADDETNPAAGAAGLNIEQKRSSMGKADDEGPDKSGSRLRAPCRNCGITPANRLDFVAATGHKTHNNAEEPGRKRLDSQARKP